MFKNIIYSFIVLVVTFSQAQGLEVSSFDQLPSCIQNQLSQHIPKQDLLNLRQTCKTTEKSTRNQLKKIFQPISDKSTYVIDIQAAEAQENFIALMKFAEKADCFLKIDLRNFSMQKRRTILPNPFIKAHYPFVYTGEALDLLKHGNVGSLTFSLSRLSVKDIEQLFEVEKSDSTSCLSSRVFPHLTKVKIVDEEAGKPNIHKKVHQKVVRFLIQRSQQLTSLVLQNCELFLAYIDEVSRNSIPTSLRSFSIFPELDFNNEEIKSKMKSFCKQFSEIVPQLSKIKFELYGKEAQYLTSICELFSDFFKNENYSRNCAFFSSLHLFINIKSDKIDVKSDKDRHFIYLIHKLLIIEEILNSPYCWLSKMKKVSLSTYHSIGKSLYYYEDGGKGLCLTMISHPAKIRTQYDEQKVLLSSLKDLYEQIKTESVIAGTPRTRNEIFWQILFP